MEVLDSGWPLPRLLAVMVTGFGGVTEAVSAMKRGAADFLIKPFQIAQLSRVLKAGWSSGASARERRAPRPAPRSVPVRLVVGQSGAMQSVFQTLELVARDEQHRAEYHGEPPGKS